MLGTLLHWRQNQYQFPAKILKPLKSLTSPNYKTQCSQKISAKEKKQSNKKIQIPTMGKDKQYWLLKTEPREWSWDDQASNEGISNWDGVKNKQAQKYLKSMKLDDLCFFYHSGNNARRIVGVVTVVREWYPEDNKGNVGAVDVKEVGEMRRPVDLKEMKGEEGLEGFALFRQPRLSVVPVPEGIWVKLCELGGGFDGDGNVVEDENESGDKGDD